MAYGKRIYCQFNQEGTDTLIDVEIHQNLYVGTATEVVLGEVPFTVRMSGSGNKYEIIKGSECTINIAVRESDDLSWLYTNDDRKYKVIIKYNSAIWWTGFLLSNQYSEEFTYDGFVSVTASDQLGLLNAKSYTFGSPAISPSGYDTIINILNKALSKTNLDLNVISSFNLFEATMSVLDDDDPFLQASVNQDLWINDDGTAMDCRTVIEEILRPFQCRILQSSGVWYIQRVAELSGALIDYRAINTSGIAYSDGQYNPQKETGTDLAVLAGGTLGYESGWTQRSINVDYVLKKSQVPNYNLPDNVFSQDNPAQITGWTNTGAWAKLSATGVNLLWAKTVAWPGSSNGIQPPSIDVTMPFEYNISIRCGRIQTSLLQSFCPVTLVVWDGSDPLSKRYYNDEDNEWKEAAVQLTKINFPITDDFNNLTVQTLAVAAPPINGKMYLTFVDPYRGVLTASDAWFYFNDIKITSSVDSETDKIASQVFTDFITDETSYIPPDESIRISDGLGDDSLIPYYNGFILVGGVCPQGWEPKATFGEGIPMPLISHTLAAWGVIPDGWYWQFYTSSMKYSGSFLGSMQFHNTVKFAAISDTIFMVDDAEIDLKSNIINGTFIEIKPETYGGGSGTMSLKSRGTNGSTSGSGIIPQPGGSDGQLQFKSGGDFSGTTNVTWDGTRLLKGGTLPLIEYRCGSETVASGEQAVTFAEAFVEGDDYAMLPIWITDPDGSVYTITPSDLTYQGFTVNTPNGGTFTYLAIIKR